MRFKFIQGQSVSFDNGFLKGTGHIVGCSSIPAAVIGATYMISVDDITHGPDVPNETYPFTTIAVAECHISN